MREFELPIKNFEAQENIFNSKARIVAIHKGRRFGFTKGAANNTIKKALSGRYKKGLWVDTVNSNIERYVERYFVPALSKLPPSMWSWRKQQKILTINKFYMDFRSVDIPENIEGFGYDYMILNEAGIILKNEYLWSNAIRPMMWDYPCQVFIGGTPKGKGVFWDLCQRGRDPQQPQFATFHYTSFDNPRIPSDIIMEDIRSMPERVVKQEIYAEFLDDTGVVFRDVAGVCVLGPQEPDTTHIYVIGCDLAKVQDYTVLTVYDRKTNEQVYQMRFNKLEWPFQKARIKELSAKYNNALVIMDSTGLGEPIHDDLVRDGVPCQPVHFTNDVKKQLVEKLSTYIELRYIKMLHIEETIQELLNFTYDYSEKTGRVMYGAPVGFHDDIVFSHALAVWGLYPLPAIKQEPKLSIIQRDIMEKKKLAEFTQNPNQVEYESI